MNQYSWSSAYVAAIEEHDRIALQWRIDEARKLMSERIASLVSNPISNGESEELQRLRDCRRALDLLERVSNDLELFPDQGMGKTA